MAEPERSDLSAVFINLFGWLCKLFCIEREEPTRSKDPTYGVSSSSCPPHEGDYKDGDERERGNDTEDLNSKASSSSNPVGGYEGIDEQQKGNINKDLNSKASCSLTPPHEGDYEGGDEQTKGNDIKDLNSKASSSSTPPHEGDYEGGHEQQRGNNYEVFLSFRGKDTRTGFTSYLYTRLVNAGIRVFIDKINLPTGEPFGRALLHTIEQSKIFILIISENYAFSTWCLRELAHMLKCKRKEGQIMLPIFYKVKPSQVRNLGKEWRDAITARNENLHERDLKEWKEALEEVSRLEALESEEIDNGKEGTLVEMVFKKVMYKLKRLFQLDVPKQLVGIDNHVEQIRRSIDAQFNGMKIIGIYGMGGIGKTTLAKVLYNTLSCHFDRRIYVENVRGKGISCIQKQLISTMIENFNDVSTVAEGIGILESQFTKTKVLILLDDVGDDTKLSALVGDGSWFLAGSVVIITTRNKRNLLKVKASTMYQLNQLSSNQSLILFSRHAFLRDSPPSDYEEISRAIVSTTSGLPLALVVIGSLLGVQTMEQWKSTLEKLKKVPNSEVLGTLKISYDALDYWQKEIFLDIACFFNGKSRENPTYMWKACGFCPGDAIDVLSYMSLVKIDEDGTLTMHDQLKDLALEMVRQENPRKPQNRSRLWDAEDVEKVLDGNKGTDDIVALCLPPGGIYTAEKFEQMTNLRFLRADSAELTGDFKNLFPELRWLEWWDCYSNFEVTIFQLKKLIVLDLSISTISEDWGGWSMLKMTTELKVLNLMGCYFLRTTPDLSTFKSLEILILENCENLEEIHHSIYDIKTLISLNVGGCSKLMKLPLGIDRMENLKELLIHDTNIREIPILRGCLTKLENICASNCQLLTSLPESLGSLVSLTQLYLSHTKIEELPESICSLKELKTLDASNCRLLARLPKSLGSLVSLTQLYLSYTKIEELPESICSLKELKTLDASYCTSLSHIPTSIGALTSLSHLDLTGCYKLAQFPNCIGILVYVQSWCLPREIPYSIEKLKSWTELCVRSTQIKGNGFTKIEEMLESIASLKQLKTLDASWCVSLARIPSSIGHLASLSVLNLTGCVELAQLPNSIGSLVSLELLFLSECRLLNEIPESIGKLALLTELHLNSTAIRKLPESIGNLQNLRMLDISGTPIVKLLNDRGILVELKELKALGWKSPEGPPSTRGQPVSPNYLDLDQPQKLSGLQSRLLALVLLKHPKMTPANNSAMDYERAYSKHVLQRSIPHGISYEDSESMADVKPKIADESGDNSRIWIPTEINEPLQCRSIRLPDNLTASRVLRLIYTHSGGAILALSSNAVHKLWKWQESDQNLTGRATTSVVPRSWQPPSGILMTNDTKGTNSEDEVPCFALSKNDRYLISASGGEISVFDMKTFKTLKTFMPPAPSHYDTITIGIEDSSIQIYSGQDDEIQKKLKGHQRKINGFAFSTSLNVLMSSGVDSQTMTTFTPRPPPATFLALHPQDNNIIAIGMEDSSIQIYYIQVDEFKANLKGHRQRITGLAFSNILNILVSSGADSQLCVWSINGWEKQASKFLHMPTRLGATPLADTCVQFHVDQIHLLVVHETQIATYEAPKLECLMQWVPRKGSPITDATYSCNGQSIYASFKDGSIGVLTASTLRLRCRIDLAAYIPPNPSSRVYPLVIAAHPSESNQFALGLTDGSVYVLEPLEFEGDWGSSPPVEYGAGPSTTSGATSSDQPQR